MTTTPEHTHRAAEEHPGWAHAHLRTPDGRNSLDGALARYLLDALAQAEAAPHCRALVFSSDTPYFCTGLALPPDGRAPDWLSAPAPGPLDVFHRIAESLLVTVAVVEGPAIGGGVGLAAACDIVVAGPAATFRLTETVIGLTPKVIMPYLVRRLGAHRAHTLALTGVETSSHRALALGLADYATSTPAGCLRAVLAAVRRTDPQAVRTLKADYNGLHQPSDQDRERAALELAEAFTHPQVHSRLAELRAVGALP